MPRERLSLKARALTWLAQREHSRVELRRKLLRVARAEHAEHAAREGAGSAAAADSSADDSGCDEPERRVDELLAWLQQHHYLSEARFLESRVHARSARYGNLRIRQELAQHGVSPDEDTLSRLRETEMERARAVWRRKFPAPAADAAERARQIRFLVQRGFSAEVVRRVVRGSDDEGF